MCVVDRAEPRRKQDGEVAADRVARLVPEHLFGAAVEMNDPLAVIDRDDGVGGDGQDARELGL
jgi:hypothetical protein